MSKLRLADPRSFVTSPAPGGRIIIHTPLGLKTVESDADVYRVGGEVIDEMAKKLGRPPTYVEAMDGPRPREDRSVEEMQARHDFKPKVLETAHPYEKMASDLLGDTRDHQMKGMSLRERLATDLISIAERDGTEADARSTEQTRLAKLKPELEKIDALIEAERWKAERGSQLMLDRLEMFREQLLAPNADPAATASRRKAVKLALNERAQQEREVGNAKIATLQRQIDAIKGGEVFVEPEPELEAGTDYERLVAAEKEATAARQQAEKRSAEAKAKLDAHKAAQDAMFLDAAKKQAARDAEVAKRMEEQQYTPGRNKSEGEIRDDVNNEAS